MPMKIAAALALIGAIPAQAGTLYSVDASYRGLYVVNTTTAVATQIATTPASSLTIGELAYAPTTNTVYAATTNKNSLYTLNLTTGATTLVGAFGTTGFMHGLEWDSANSTLYGVTSNFSGTMSFYSISTSTGQATAISTMPTALNYYSELGFDSTNNVMYLSNSLTNSLYTIDVTTGALSLVGSFGSAVGAAQGMTYDADTRTMYMVDNYTNQLFTVNLSTGLATAVGSTDRAMIGLVYVANPVPEPASYALFGLGLAGLGLWRRRKCQSSPSSPAKGE